MRNHSHIKRVFRQRGFALVVTLSLMILLTVVAVALLSISTVSLRRSSQEKEMQVARANARLAMIMALGELQKHLGPDTRVSARAETLAKLDSVGGSVAANSPEAWWVGVTDSDRSKTLSGTSGETAVWLVSGLQGQTAAAQLAGGFINDQPATMVGEGSLDLTLTGGRPIEAGRVQVRNATGRVTGAYAWYVDDNGMKAQLAPSDVKVMNNSTAGPLGGPFGGGVIPGGYPIGILDSMSGIGSPDPSLVNKLPSTNSLPLLNLSPSITRSEYFSYTTSSRGVLADVKKGGLKKDLTIAFETEGVFDNAFPSGDANKYILVDPLKRPTDLTRGYINWSIIRDYYNLKKYLFTNMGRVTIAPTTIEKNGFIAGALESDAFRTGRLGPHAMAANAPGSLPTMPYGKMSVSPGGPGGSPGEYPFHPITPVMQAFQQNAWVSQVPGTSPARARTNAQMFSSHYNPYNVGMMLASGEGNGPRLLSFPQVYTTVSGTTINQAFGFHSKLQSHVGSTVYLDAGRSHIMGYRGDVERGSSQDSATYSQDVSSIVNQSVYLDHNSVTLPTSGTVRLTFEFALTTPAFIHGVDENPGDREMGQIFFAPFGWDPITTPVGIRAGKKIIKNVAANQLTNTRASMGFRLRTTRETDSRIRPLVDANIRAVWNNARWDSPLGLPLLAAYSTDGNGEIQNQPIPQMEIGTPSRGFSYWGNSRSPSNGNDRVILFDIPRRDLVSLGQLQHANVGRFSYEPTYIIGNSYANPRIPLPNWNASITDSYSGLRGIQGISGSFNLYDASYLVNEVLFDSYVFTTIPQVQDDFVAGGQPVSAQTYSGLKDGSLQLPNPRYLPYSPAGSDFNQGVLQNPGNATSGSFYTNAGHLLVDGSFNVNSTSVDAWEAFLSGTHALPVTKISESGEVNGFHTTAGVRFPRSSSHLQDGMKTSSIDSSYWTGFRDLEQDEVRALATEIVNEVKERGPFLSLGEFVNRKLVNSDLGRAGALQAALDKTVNRNLDSSYEAASSMGSTQGAGFPGQVLQGDVLQALAPCMTVRSDTFTIRAYGEARDSANQVTARAWCETTVQRMPDPVASTSNTNTNAMSELALPTSEFGRKFEVLAFRWLHPDEV